MGQRRLVRLTAGQAGQWHGSSATGLREQAHDLVIAMYDGDFSFDECERVQAAIREFDAGADGLALERLLDCWAAA